MKKLYVIDGPNKGKSFNLNDGITAIGRSPDNDIHISDKGVSRHHGKFLQKDDRIFIVDLNSLQGVFIDGEKVEPGLEVEIKKESKVTIGKTILSFQKESSGKKPAKPYPTDVERKPFDTSKPLKDDSRNYTYSMELLLKVSNILAQSLHIDELLDEVLDQIFNFLERIDRGAILLLNKEAGKLEEVVSKTRIEDKEGVFSKINYSRTIVKRTIKGRKPVMMSDTSHVGKADLSDSMEQMNVRSVMCVPLIYKGDFRGVIYVDSIGLPEGFRKDDLQLLTSLSNSAAIAIENARLYETMNQELSERKRAEEALKESEARYRALFQGSAEGIIVADVETKEMIYANPAICRMLGYTGEELKLMTIRDIHPKEDLEHVISEFEAIAQGDKTLAQDIPSLRKDGTTIYADITGSKILINGRECNVGFFTDITKEKKLQAQLQQARKMEAIATLAGGIAHEFNNTLVGITGNIDLLQMDLPDDENIEKYTQHMKNSAHRMAHLTEQLLAYARGGKYQAKNISLTDFVQETLPWMKQSIDPSIRIETDLPHDILNVEADLTQMQIVLSVIFNNSVEAIEEKDRIRITTKNEEIKKEFAKTHPGLKPGPYVSLTIEDDGKGMDEETRNRIFDPFFTTKVQGRGLGMAAVYGIVKNHGGWVSVDSELGKGTVVRIYLPAVKVEVKEEERPKIEPAKGTGTILVIEDEEVVIDVICAMLERLGYSTLLAETGKKALDIAKNFDGNIDLAILDIILPDLPGKEIYRHIMEARPNLKVIVCSGYAIDGPPQEILDAGAQDFIQKPFSVATLSEKLKEVLEGK